MQTKPRANSVITWAQPDERTLVCKVQGCPDIIFDTKRLHPAQRDRFMLHGIRQRVQDAAALSRDTKTGQPATPQARHAAMMRVVEHYMSGSEDWELVRAAPTPGLDHTILAAVAEGIGRSTDEVRAMVQAGAAKHNVKPADYLARLATADKVKPILERMRAEQVTVDANDELEAMMAQGEDGGEGDASTDEARV